MNETSWWDYVQDLIDGDTARQAGKRAGFDSSAFSRWKRGASPEPAFAVRLARAYNGNVLEALIKADLITPEEADLRHVTQSRAELLRSLSDLDLAEALVRRLRHAQPDLVVRGGSTEMFVELKRSDQVRASQTSHNLDAEAAPRRENA